MIKDIEVKNYKSIAKLKLSLGRLNVFIGENGAGKSNILEVIALAGASVAEKLDNEFLASRGIRVTNPEYMRSAFPDDNPSMPISVSLSNEFGKNIRVQLNNDNAPYSKWTDSIQIDGVADFDALVHTLNSLRSTFAHTTQDREELAKFFSTFAEGLKPIISPPAKKSKNIRSQHTFTLPDNNASYQFESILTRQSVLKSGFTEELGNFVIFSPENSSLRKFEREGQIEPLGINGEGLLKLLTFYSADSDTSTLDRVRDSMGLLDWFSGFSTSTISSDARLLIKDRYLKEQAVDFDHKSANEGFLFLLFYFLLFNSALTPKFFAIDNIDASLNPKLCAKLVAELAKLARLNDKQTILTTHNPSVLDGLDLDDDDQRLFVVSRSRDGTTKVKRIKKPQPLDGMPPVRMSELFIRGLIGGIPKGF